MFISMRRVRFGILKFGRLFSEATNYSVIFAYRKPFSERIDTILDESLVYTTQTRVYAKSARKKND